MFEQNMDEYLDEELESLKQSFDSICKGWSKNVRFHGLCLTYDLLISIVVVATCICANANARAGSISRLA
jgi:hypothetical protein